MGAGLTCFNHRHENFMVIKKKLYNVNIITK
jgi:hypothetical protein